MSDDNEKSGALEITPAASGSPVKWWVAVLETVASTFVVAILLKLLSRSGQKYETNWILISVLPIIFWLFFSGRLASLKAFGVELKAAIRRASNETITLDQELQYEPVDPAEKADIALIPNYIQRRVTAISFQLGRQGYYAVSALRNYLEGLLPYPFFKYVVFTRDRRFAGIVRAHTLYLFGTIGQGTESGFRKILASIERGDVKDIPGVIGAELALKATDTRGQAMGKFERTDADELPVVNGEGILLGTVNRGRLVSEVLTSIVRAAGDGA